MKKLDFPISKCTIDITENCNLRCGYCFTYFNSKYKRKDLSYEQGIKIIDWLFKDEVSQSDNIDINWWGGEPLFKFDMMKKLTDYALEKASKEKKQLTIGGTSNGTLMNKEVVDWMNKYRSYFMISIDGPKDIQDSNRPCAVKGCSSWDMIEKNLPYIMEQIPFLNSRMSPTPQHIHRMAETFRLFYDKYHILTQMYSPVCELEWTKEKLNIAEDQLKQICDMIVEKRLQGKEFNVKHLDDAVTNIEMKRSRAEFPCGAGRFYVGISTEGIIYPCHRFNKYDGRDWREKAYIGNIDDGIINKEFRDQFIHYLEHKVPDECINCELYGNLCDRPCYAICYDLEGNINKSPKVVCDWNKMHAKVAYYYYNLLKKNNLPIPGMQRGENMNMKSCICNNMCYLQGSDNEIIDVDPNSDAGCMCNQTSYCGPKKPENTRVLEQSERLKILNERGMFKNQINKPSVGMSSEGANLLNKLHKQLESMDQTNKALIDAILKLAESIKK